MDTVWIRNCVFDMFWIRYGYASSGPGQFWVRAELLRIWRALKCVTGARNDCGMVARLCRFAGGVREGEGDGVIREGEGGGGRRVVGRVGSSTLHATVIMSGSSEGCGGLVDRLRWGGGETVGGLWASCGVVMEGWRWVVM